MTKAKRLMPTFLIQLFVLATVLVGFQVFASEFDEEVSSLPAPEVLIVREDADGNRVILGVEEAPEALETDAERRAFIEYAEAEGELIDSVQEGGEGDMPTEFDEATGTPAWNYWYYPNTYYSYWYSYGWYSYYPAYSYSWGYYNYWYYYRW